MKITFLRIAAIAPVGFFPSLAKAHPGHSAFDFISGFPHPGHEAEFAILLSTAALAGLLWVVARSLFGRRG